MDPGLTGHIIHNAVLIAVYLLLGTVYLPGFIRRLDIPAKSRKLFRMASFVFFVLCAYTHTELLIHASELPADFFTWSHNIFGFAQAAGAVGVLFVLHPLIFTRKKA